MGRLFRILRDFLDVVSAASQASHAVAQHRMPAKAALSRLGISEERMRQIHL